MSTAVQNKIKEFAENYPAKTLSAKTSLQKLIKDGYCFYVEQGKIRLYSQAFDKKEFTINVSTKGCLCPLREFYSNNNDYMVEAYVDSVIRVIPIVAAKNFIMHDVDVANEINTKLVKGLEKMTVRLAQAYYFSASQKIVAILIYLADKYGIEPVTGSAKIRFDQNYTHDDLASFTGLSRETVSRELEKLKSQQLVDISYKQIFITNYPALKGLVSKHPYIYQLS